MSGTVSACLPMRRVTHIKECDEKGYGDIGTMALKREVRYVYMTNHRTYVVDEDASHLASFHFGGCSILLKFS